MNKNSSYDPYGQLPSLMKKNIENILAAALLALFVALAFGAQERESVTVDEFAHLPAGYSYWLAGDYSLYPENPPLIKLLSSLPGVLAGNVEVNRDPASLAGGGWRPWIHGLDFMARNQGQYLKLFRMGRLVNIMLGLLLGLLVWRTSRQLYGPEGGLTSLALYATSPAVLAHSGLATIDIGAALFMTAAIVALLRFMTRPGVFSALFAGLSLGVALATKNTALSLLPLAAAAPLLGCWLRRERLKITAVLKSFGLLSISIIVSLIVIGLCYKGQGLFLRMDSFPLKSGIMASIKNLSGWLPLPVPQWYIRGLDKLFYGLGRSEFLYYLLGNWYSGSVWYYYPIALAVKNPVPTLLIVSAALLIKRPDRSEAVLLATAAWLFLPFLTGKVQIGIRFLLPVFPLVFIYAGRAGKWASGRKTGLFKLLLLFICAAQAVIAIRAFPRYLSFFNVFGGGEAGGYRVLLDSNYDWGQDLPQLADYMKKNGINEVELYYFGHVPPELYGIRQQLPGTAPEKRHIAISLQYLMSGGRYAYPLLYRDPPAMPDPAILERYKDKTPLARLGSIWLFDKTTIPGK